ncbi:MAG: hypothetical protein AB1705_00315 [Verrucomicrobiota bacterium]
MESRITSTSARRQAGMGLTEMIVSVGIAGMVLTAVALLSYYTTRSMAEMSNYSDLEQQSRQALDQMTYRIRSADQLVSYTSDQLEFSYCGGRLKYTYSPGMKTLTQEINGTTTTLLKDCAELNFTVFQRTVASNSFNQYVASGPGDAKSVVVKWKCAKNSLNLANTECMQSARIVIRNNPDSL